jgi:hypothetical protein
VSELIPGAEYISVNMSFTLIIAWRSVSPVPSFAFVPTFNVCCAILCVHNLSNHGYSVAISITYRSP